MHRFITIFFAFSLAFFLVGAARFFYPEWFEGGFLDFVKNEESGELRLPPPDDNPGDEAQETEKTVEERLIEETPADEQALFERAQKFFSHGALSLAQNDLSVLLEKNPNHKEAYLMLIKVHIRKRNFAEAEGVARRALGGSFPDDPDFLLLLGDLFLQQGESRLIEAKNTFALLPESSPERNYYLGVIAIAEGDMDLAQNLFEKAKSSTVFNRRSDMILAAFNEFSLFPDGSPLHRDTLLAKALNDAEQFEISLMLTKKVLLENAGYRDAWLVNGYSYLALERYEFTYNAFTQAFSIDPAHADSAFFLGLTNKRLGDYDRAVSFYERAIENGFTPEKEVLREIADAYYLGEKYELSLKEYEKMLELYGGEVSDFIRPMNIALTILKDTDTGISLGNWVVETYPNEALAWNLRGWAYLEKNDLATAESDLKKSLELDNKLAAAYLNLGIVRERQERIDEALNLFETVYEMDPLSEIGEKAVEHYNALVE